MSTVSNGRDTVSRLRRRPATTATNARTSRAVFGDKATKELEIPEFIDMYNHFMNGVDVADQLRSYYNTQRTHFKTWKPLWHFLLDVTITNGYKIAHCTPERPNGEGWRHYSHKQFRTKLASQLFGHSERLGVYRQPPKPLSAHVYQATEREHGHITSMGSTKYCKACECAKRPVRKQAAIRRPLGKLSVNSTVNAGTNTHQKRRDNRCSRTKYGCKLCGIHLCRNWMCWKEHIEAIQ